MTPDAAAWKRLGSLLVRRRVELDLRYKNRSLFARERGIEVKIVYAIEKATRSNFEPQTLALLEHAYNLPTGAIDRALSGGELEPPDDSSSSPGGAQAVTPTLDARDLLAEFRALSPAQRRRLVRELVADELSDDGELREA